MNFILSIAVSAIRALSMFFAGKIVLVAFGTTEFAAHAQLGHILTVMLPVSCGLTSLAVINAWANSDRLRALRVIKTSIFLTIILMLLSSSILFFVDITTVSKFAFGTSEWKGVVLLLPVAVALASATSLSTASLVGMGKGRFAAIVDACMSLIALSFASIAAINKNIEWIIYSPIPILGIGVLSSTLAIRWNKDLFTGTAKRNSVLVNPETPTLISYIIMSLAASAVAPSAMLMARSTLLNHAGPDEASSFIAAQRLVALVITPVPLYAYTFLSPFFSSASHEQAIIRIRKLQLILFLIASVAYAILTSTLHIVTPLAFSDEIMIPVELFALVAIGETVRIVAGLQAQYLASNGRWKTFLVGDFVFLCIFLGVFLTFGPSGIWIAGAYALAGIGYLIYMVKWGSSPSRGARIGI